MNGSSCLRTGVFLCLVEAGSDVKAALAPPS